MIIDNVYVFTPDKAFVKGGIILDGDKIRQVYEEKDAPQLNGDVLDGKGCYAIPGLIDLHFHGCKGDDFCDGDKDAIGRIAEYEASVGVTAIAPATMTLPVEELEQILHTAAEYKKETKNCRKADFLGINMEGPFISPAKKGAQDARNILPCNVEICDRFLKASEGLVKFIGIAPEESEHAAEFIREVHERVNVSLAHTNADYDTAMEACRAGANHAVHLYNAMPAFTHRAPGVVGAVFDNKDVMAEIICDGIHIHPSVEFLLHLVKEIGTAVVLAQLDVRIDMITVLCFHSEQRIEESGQFTYGHFPAIDAAHFNHTVQHFDKVGGFACPSQGIFGLRSFGFRGGCG